MKKDYLDPLAIILLIMLCASWGYQNIAVKQAINDISPVMQSALRSFGASILVALWIWGRKKPIFEKDGTLWWGIAAGLLFGGEFLLVYWGLTFTNVSRAIIFLYMSPFVVALGSQLFFPAEKLNKIQYVGLLCAFIGIIFAFGESFSLPSQEMLIGDTMLIVAAVMWGATTVLVKASPLAHTAPSKTLFYQVAVSAPCLLLGSWALGEPGIVRWSSTAIWAMLYNTVWVATITYITWFWLVKHYPAPKLASFSFMTPLFGVMAGVLILDEPLTTSMLIAAAFVAVGIYLVNRPNERKTK